MEVQGVLFYVLSGDHPQASNRESRLGIAGTRTTVSAFVDQLCRIHGIHEAKYRLDVFAGLSREALPRDAELKSYDRLRVTCAKRQIKEVMEHEEESEARRRGQREEERSARMLQALKDAAQHQPTGSSPSGSTSLATSGYDGPTPLLRISSVATKRLPLRLHPRREVEEGGPADASCVLCGLPLPVDPAAVWLTLCCRYPCCRECIDYAGTTVNPVGACPVCGAGSDATAQSHHLNEMSGRKCSRLKHELLPVLASDDKAATDSLVRNASLACLTDICSQSPWREIFAVRPTFSSSAAVRDQRT